MYHAEKSKRITGKLRVSPCVEMWTISAAVLVLAFGSATADHVFSCDALSFESCNCSTDSQSFTELLCPQLSVQLYITQINVILQCTSSENISYTSLSGLGLRIGDINSFILKSCLLPEIPLKDLMERIGINKIKFLDIHSYGDIKNVLRKMHFEKLYDVTNLVLNNNGLTYLPSNLFEDMMNLTSLDLKYNRIELPKDIFYYTPKLQILDLAMNNLTYLDPVIFKNLNYLTFLSVWGNKLTNLTRSLFSDTPNLEILVITENDMEALTPNLFDDLDKLKQLDLSNNRFTSLPQGIFSRNVKLELFEMIDNNSPNLSLPTGLLSNLTMLTVINMRSSMITALPENIFSGSKNLVNINLRNNSLSTLSQETFTDLESLEYLDLSVNTIEHLPGKLFHQNLKLKNLMLHHNNIMEIPSELFLGLEKIEHLDLSFNKIKSITGNQFYGLQSLKTLDLSNNQLTSPGLEYQSFDVGRYSVFQRNTRLEVLQLSNNLLTEIYPDWKSVLKNLRILNLSYNQFQLLRADDLEFKGNTSIDLSNNEISLVDFRNASTEAVESSKIVNLGNNPFHCDCQLLPFSQYLRGEQTPEAQHLYNIPTQDLKCSEPKEFDKMSLSEVPYNMLKCQFTNGTESYE